MKRLFLIAVLLIIGASFPAYGQSPVITQPYGATNHNDSGVIAVTNTFQSIWPASTSNTGRTDCIIQNIGSSTMYIYFGPIANATTQSSLSLASSGIFRCGNSGVISKDQISITGTSTQRFFAVQF